MPGKRRLACHDEPRHIMRIVALLLLVCMSANGTRVKLKTCLTESAGSGGSSARTGTETGSGDQMVIAMLEETEEDDFRRWWSRRAEKIVGSRRAQSFSLRQLKIQWDTWSSSQMVTAAAAIILRDRLGFDVTLEAGRSSKQTYQALATGEVHLAFEVWPQSNLETFRNYVAIANNRSKKVQYLPNPELFGRSGIYESCSRAPGDTTFQTCLAGMPTMPMLRYKSNARIPVRTVVYFCSYMHLLPRDVRFDTHMVSRFRAIALVCCSKVNGTQGDHACVPLTAAGCHTATCYKLLRVRRTSKA